ncbi:MAG: hypothetical protein AAF098_16675, partial [Pseudomonadota bacterium]
MQPLTTNERRANDHAADHTSGSGYRVYNERPLRILAGWRATFLEYQDVGVLALLLKKEMKIIDIQTPMCGRQHGHSRVFHSWL